jgi:hypothetical protein
MTSSVATALFVVSMGSQDQMGHDAAKPQVPVEP